MSIFKIRIRSSNKDQKIYGTLFNSWKNHVWYVVGCMVGLFGRLVSFVGSWVHAPWTLGINCTMIMSMLSRVIVYPWYGNRDTYWLFLICNYTCSVNGPTRATLSLVCVCAQWRSPTVGERHSVTLLYYDHIPSGHLCLVVQWRQTKSSMIHPMDLLGGTLYSWV